MDKTDPICGMQGTIEAHNHFFCSFECIREYEDQESIPASQRYDAPLDNKTPAQILVAILAFGFLVGAVSPSFMGPFMGSFLVVVASLKLADVRGFAMAFSNYDLISRVSMGYAFAYPFIELALGVALLASNLVPVLVLPAAIVLIVVMLSSLIGVFLALRAGRKIVCACLGSLIAVPLTTFTIIENVAMILMALLIV